MGNENAEINNRIGMSFLRQSHQKIHEENWGDISIQIWRDSSGSPYVRMERGKPSDKTFCLDHFLKFADKVQVVADKVRERLGEL